MATKKSIEDFIKNNEIAVAGASANKKKFGYIIFDKLRKKQYNVYPVNPITKEIDGVKCYSDINNLPASVKAIIFVTQPEVTEKITEQISENKNIEYLWFQPGSVSKTSDNAEKLLNKNIIKGECILMYLEPSGFPHTIHKFFNKLFGKYPK